MNSGYDIIMLALPRWDGAYSSTSYCLAKEFAKTHRVFYIDNPFTYKDFIYSYQEPKIQSRKTALLFGKEIFKKANGAPDNFTAVTPPLVIPSNFLPRGFIYNALSKINDKFIFATIRKIIKQKNISEFIFINSFNPFYARKFPADLKPLLKIYHTVDDISQSRYTSKHGQWLEKEAASRADLTFSTSKQLTILMQKVTANAYYLPNAAEISLFQQAAETKLERPAELKDITTPVICYIGNLDKLRVDYILLKKIAEYHPDKTLLLVGPCATQCYKDYGLEKIKNIVITGAKPIHELPNYLQHVDCTIIPFVCSELTKSIYPLKINEYLAAGKPVVSTRFSEDITDFAEVTYLAESNEDFLQLINQAIAEDSIDKINKRRIVAEKNTWQARSEAFFSIVKKYLQRKHQLVSK